MAISARLSIFVLAVLCSPAAFAQLARTAVSVNGNDLNNCSTATPCRSFSRAITQTNPNGEMIALDSGGYGPFTVDRPVSVQAAPGVYAGITAATGAGISVTPGQFSQAVMLRGLFVNGTGGTTGIDISNAFDVFVDKCTVQNFGVGISLTSIGNYNVTETIVRGNGSGDGIVIGSPTGSPEVTIDSCRLIDNNRGLVINDRASVVMFRSVVAQNGSSNVVVSTINPAHLTVSECLVHGYNRNGEAIRSQAAGANVTVTRSTIADCATGFNNVGAVFNSTLDNTINNCTTATLGTITPLAQQ